jgi:hypothetical protein
MIGHLERVVLSQAIGASARAPGNTRAGRTLSPQRFQEIDMHRAIPLLVSLATLAAVTVSVQARPRAQLPQPAGDRYCLQGVIWGWPGNCMYATYQQCMASASGTYAYCSLNPIYAFAEQRRGY